MELLENAFCILPTKPKAFWKAWKTHSASFPPASKMRFGRPGKRIRLLPAWKACSASFPLAGKMLFGRPGECLLPFRLQATRVLASMERPYLSRPATNALVTQIIHTQPLLYSDQFCQVLTPGQDAEVDTESAATSRTNRARKFLLERTV